MIVSLCGYFDLGASYGLADDAFATRSGTLPNEAAILVPDIESVGLRNPLGAGITVPLDESVLALWREAAAAKAYNRNMELGFKDDEPDAARRRADLERLAREHPVRGEVTVYAVGTAYLQLDLLDGVPLQLARRLARCFEYAAYRRDVAGAIYDWAKAAVEETGMDRLEAMQRLSQRPLPRVQRDERGVEEWMLIPSFTHVVRRTSALESLDAIRQFVLPLDFEIVPFEYHGTLYFNWSGCILDPRGLDTAADPVAVSDRMMWCIRIAHSLLATCEAFDNLTLTETVARADSHLRGRTQRGAGRDLNRLRTLALAVRSMVRYDQVTQAEEDQRFFALWERHARIASRNEAILQRCEVLHNVHEVERQAQENRRSRLLNDIMFTLTAITLIGFLTGAYDFLRDEEQWLATARERAAALIGSAVLLYLFLRMVMRRTGGPS